MAELRNQEERVLSKESRSPRALIAGHLLRNGDAAASANIAGARAPTLAAPARPKTECATRLVDVKVAASECGFLFVLLRETTAAAYIYLPLTKSEMSDNGWRCGATTEFNFWKRPAGFGNPPTRHRRADASV